MKDRDNRNIIIFDGVCNFCNGAVNFIIKRDSKGTFSFTPMQSEIAQELIRKHDVPKVGFDTFLLIKKRGRSGKERHPTCFWLSHSCRMALSLIRPTALMVEINHGVRVIDKKKDGSEVYLRNEARNIYSSSLSFDEIPAYKWRHMGLNPFMKNWKVERNVIPRLTFTKS